MKTIEACTCMSVAEWFKAAVSKTAKDNSFEGSNPSRHAFLINQYVIRFFVMVISTCAVEYYFLLRKEGDELAQVCKIVSSSIIGCGESVYVLHGHNPVQIRKIYGRKHST